jgi:hypothetical protein
MKKRFGTMLWIILICLLVSYGIVHAGALTSMKAVKAVPDGAQVFLDGYVSPGFVDAEVLTGGAAVVHYVPYQGTTTLVKIKCTGDVWVNVGAAAAVPGAAITDGSSSILNPPGFLSIGSATYIGLIAAANNKCSLEWFKP